MATVQRASGVVVTVPDGVSVEGRPPARRGGRVTREQAGTSSTLDLQALVDAFDRQDMKLVDVIPLHAEPAVGADRRRRGVAAAAEVSVPVAPKEDAVVLLDQDGVLSWDYPTGEAAAPGRTRRRRDQPRMLVFRIPLFPVASAPSGPTRRTFLRDFVVGKVKAYVFKFAARVLVGSAMTWLERNVRRCLVHVSTPDPAQWTPLDDSRRLRLPGERPARILLLVHGTFSSTVGAFGTLGGTPWGQEFIKGALASYDAVLGYDHPTLSVDPLANATDLHERLAAIEWSAPPRFDVVVHSRGGLVIRSLLEHLLPLSEWKPQIGRVVFVAATNGGTQLASPANWKDFIDLYTNLAVATCRLLAMIPQATSVSVVLKELVQGLGAFVQHCTVQAVTEGQVPGLAAMEPGGAFVTSINQVQPGQPTIQTSDYLAVTSEFEPKLQGSHEPKELPDRFIQWVAGRFTHKLMGEANDLVVNTASMVAIDQQAGQFFKDVLAFGKNPQVHHCNYFVRPEVCSALVRWLSLTEPGKGRPAVGPGGGRIRRGSRAVDVAGGGALESAARSVAAVADSSVPAIVDTDILVAQSDSQVDDVFRAIEREAPSYVVVERPYGRTVLNYAIDAKEALEMISHQPSANSLAQALDMHEYSRSTTQAVNESLEPRLVQPGVPASAARSVVTESGRPVGVLPEKIAAPNAEDLVQMARSVANPRKTEDRIVARRAMPTFNSLDAGSPAEIGKSARRSGLAKSSGTGRGEPSSGSVRAPQDTPASHPRRTRRATPAPPATPPKKGAPKKAAPNKAIANGGGRKKAAPKKAAPKKAGATGSERERADRTVAAESKAQTVTCYFQAQMEKEVVVKRVTTIEVELSRELIADVVEEAVSRGEAVVDPSRKLLVQAIPKQNLEPVGDCREEVDLPAPGVKKALYFDVRATNLGEGEVWIVVRQGQVPLVTLPLKVTIVKTRTASPGRATARLSATEAPHLAQPIHQLIVTEQKNGDQFCFRYELQSPNLKVLEFVSSDPFRGDRGQFVNDLYDQIESRWLSNQDDLDKFVQELRAMGVNLLKQLFPEKLQRILWKHRASLGSIMVISEEPFIPWELIHLKDPDERALGKESWFLGQMGLVRWLHGAGWPTDRLVLRAKRAHYVIPNYPDPTYTLPEALNEATFLEKELGATAVQPDSAAVRDLINKPAAFDLLHFACHGEADQDTISNARLLLEGRMEGASYIKDTLNATVVESFANLKAADGTGPLVTLNACQAGRQGYSLTSNGGFARAFLLGGASAFVGTLWSIGDSPARTFTETFYSELLKKSTIAEAAIKARAASEAAQESTWLAYVIYGHPHAKLER
jgi:CHAT domain/Ternary complex associated domain 7